ncbi:hypothetical protein FISHEDRAFT_46255 [Fistulina hepatica ATCC 64428]|uniref:Vacuolar membrane-associated protein IML1 n=1 Tax=Fistulina hepatica ATCC 64428 TaxID=1128425 RepID=A0A0D7A845_9AGAR|nr:hypothetical protein FISHEDRAFT_46255 [Fistulina hepatica ATCC 64428]
MLHYTSWWHGVQEGDVISVVPRDGPSKSAQGYLFTVRKDDGTMKPQLQLSVPKPAADAFGLKNHADVILTKVDPKLYAADFVEFSFQDQYLGRNDMWRLGRSLVGACIHTGQDITFLGSAAGRVLSVYRGGQKVSSGRLTGSTKYIHRSLSAKVTIFIQVCRELWSFAGDGERFYEKIVHSFLPSLFGRWRDAGTNHTVTIVLISRVYYDETEIDYAAGPLRKDEYGKWYKDFYKVNTDLEVIHEWKPTLVSLKNSFWDFQRDILLTHHYHRAMQQNGGSDEPVRLVGRLSYAHDGPILEALNLGLNPTETHYIDRSLSLTGASCMLITPGTGYFRVNKRLLQLTATRILDQGFGLDLISLTRAPLHQSPIFAFQGYDPSQMSEKERVFSSPRALDPLWCADPPNEKKTTLWWEPFWVSVSFWDRQLDLPFREDRFIARAKMHQIQMLGLLEHDLTSSIVLPLLDNPNVSSDVEDDDTEPHPLWTEEAMKKFDENIFTSGKPQQTRLPVANRSSYLPPSSSSTPLSSPIVSMSPRTSTTIIENRSSNRNSMLSTPRIPPIQESPRRNLIPLPSEDGLRRTLQLSESGLSTSPSQSIMSRRSGASSSRKSTKSREDSATRSSLASKLAPSWLFHPFSRSVPSEPQTTPISASSTMSATPTQVTVSPVSALAASKPRDSTAQQSKTITIGKSGHLAEPRISSRKVPHQKSTILSRSPINTPPRDDTMTALLKRRSAALSSSSMSVSPSGILFQRTNPSRPHLAVSPTQAALASRWKFVFPQPVLKADIKWKSIVTPACLPLSTDYFPSTTELERDFDVFSYDFVVDSSEMKSFLVKPPSVADIPRDKMSRAMVDDEIRRRWALIVMRGMVAFRLAQGFQFVLAPVSFPDVKLQPSSFRTAALQTFISAEDLAPRATGGADILATTIDPVYLSTSNEIHCITYTGDTIQVRRWVRQVNLSRPFEYQCLIWPKLGFGYTEVSTKFESMGLENYGWNRLDMLVAGYENQLNESLRYWRTRFIVIPTVDPPQLSSAPNGEKLNAEEIRIMGIDKLAEQFTKLRRRSLEDSSDSGAHAPVRFLPTTLNPTECVLDDALMEQLEQIHAAGPLRKKMKSDKELADMSLSTLAQAMREDSGLIKHNHWHHNSYPNSFTGFDFVSWVVREFRDVSTRAQGAEWGVKLQEQGLLEHCRGSHNFLDGHYFYQLTGEYAMSSNVTQTPRVIWFNRNRHAPGDSVPPSPARESTDSAKKVRKRQLILSQTTVLDCDPNNRSDQAESVILHHDIIHNPANVLHFELQWIGTTARCIEDQLRQWNRIIERYGLKVVESYVTQIADVRDRNAFQSCFPIPLALAPPEIPCLEKRVRDRVSPHHYFEYALLRKFDYLLDVEAESLYPEQVDVVYSYRRSPFTYSQFVHRSGVAFVQVLGGEQGFVFLTNRLLAPGRMSVASTVKTRGDLALKADELRVELHKFCQDKVKLEDFYTEVTKTFLPVPEEPPPLSI